MPFTLLSGPVASGKTSALLDLFNERITSRSALYLVPSEFTAGEVRRLFLKRYARPLLGDAVLSWPSFMRTIAEVNKPTASLTHLTLFIYGILTTHPLRYFRPEGISWGIARECARTIVTLKHNLIDPKRLRHELATRGSLKENDFLTVYERYEAERQRHGVIDDGELTMAAASAIRRGTLGPIEGIDTILIDEFYHVMPGIVEMVRTMNDCLPGVDIWMAHPATDDEEQPYAPLWQRTTAALERFADRHERLPGPAPDKPQVVSHMMRSPSAEMRSIVTMIIDRLDGGTAPEDIEVLLRTGDDCISVLLEECERYGLIESASPLSKAGRAPLIHRLLSRDAVTALPPAGTIAEQARRMLDALRQIADVSRWQREVQDAETRQAAGRTAAAASQLEGILGALALQSRTMGDVTLGRQTFIELVRECLTDPPSWGVLTAPFTIRPFDAPPVCGARIAVVPHMVEGHIPQIAVQRLFFGEMEEWGDRRSNVLDDIFMGPEEQLGYEAALIHAIMAKAREAIIFTHPLIDFDGGETVPSSFLDAFPAVPHDVEPELDAAYATRAFERHLLHIIATEQERMRGHAVAPAYRGIITDRHLKDMVRGRFTSFRFSPTSLERYAECPFQFFAEKVLNLKPEEEVTPEILPKDRGTIIHSILEKFYRLHLDDFRRAVDARSRRAALEHIVDELVDRAFLEHASLIGYASSSLDDYQRRAVKTLVWQVIKMELDEARAVPDPLLPQRCEWYFGADDQPALHLDVPHDEPALIGGCIDRIDVNSDGSRFAIADYKTGRSVPSLRKKLKEGLHLQLPLYLHAAHTYLYPAAKPLGGILIGVQQAEKKHGFLRKSFNDVNYRLSPRLATLMDDEAWKEALAVALEAAGNYVADIREGRFPTEPRTCNDFCDYKDICRYHEQTD